MELHEATKLIGDSVIQSVPQRWADLGCGNGLFTLALANILPVPSTIFAADTNKHELKKIPDAAAGNTIEKIMLNFIREDWPFAQLDGILLANSLHFVKDKKSFLAKATRYVKPAHSFLIVEYDMDKANTWVPYPVSFISLRSLFEHAGYVHIKKLGERPSIYNRANIYASLIYKNGN